MGRLNELPQEEGASLGIGITLLLLAAVFAPWCRAGKNQSAGTRRWKVSSVGLAAWVAGLFFMLKMGSEADAEIDASLLSAGHDSSSDVAGTGPSGAPRRLADSGGAGFPECCALPHVDAVTPALAGPDRIRMAVPSVIPKVRSRGG